MLQSSDSSSNLPFKESLFIFSHGSVVVDGSDYYYHCDAYQVRKKLYNKSTSNAIKHFNTHGIHDPAAQARKEKFEENRRRQMKTIAETARDCPVDPKVYSKLQHVRITIKNF